MPLRPVIAPELGPGEARPATPAARNQCPIPTSPPSRARLGTELSAALCASPCNRSPITAPSANNPRVSIVGHGVDIVAVERIERMVAEHGERFLTRVYTPHEQDYARGKARAGEHLAARFAAKEAAFKALGTGWRDGIAWTDVAVEHDPHGRPLLVVRGRAAEVARERGVSRWWLSLSHTEGSAIASVIAERD